MQGSLLVVDDEEQIREMLSTYLLKHDYECDSADSVEAAASFLMENEYDIVITDKNMPAKDGGNEGGLELIGLIKEFDPSVVVIVMTGYATLESTISAMKLGAFDYIFKPFELSGLKTKIDRIREYQNFLNPESIMDIYSILHNEIFDLLAKSGISDGDVQQAYLSDIDDKFDFVFNTFKSWERIIVSQRERLAKISGFAEQMRDMDPEPGELTDLMNRIADEAGNRL